MERGGADADAEEAEVREGGGPGEAVAEVEVVEAMEAVDDVGEVGEGVDEFGNVGRDHVVLLAEVGRRGGRAPVVIIGVGRVGDRDLHLGGDLLMVTGWRSGRGGSSHRTCICSILCCFVAAWIAASLD